VPSIDATVSTGTGNDTVTVNTGAAATNTGMITIDTGAGNDTVNVTTRTTGKLVVMLGDGNDTFNSAVAVNGTDVIDAGNGIDTLQLKLVGASNIGAFSNFDAFDAAAMGAVTLDVDILATKNTVTEFVATATTGGATLINIGAGVGFRATGDMGNDQINLTQKAAGALTVTADIDEAAANQAGNTVTAGAHATNATSLNAVFGSDFKDANTGGNNPTPVINVTNLNLTGDAATSLNVTSGGALSTNTLNYTDTNHKLTSLTVTGSDVLTLSLTGTTALANVNASGDTGGVHLNLAQLSANAIVTLGSGADVIGAAGTTDSLVGFAKAAAAAVGNDATAAAAAIAAADVLDLTTLAGATVAADGNFTAGAVSGAVSHGVITFSGAGPTTLANAIAAVNTALTVDHSAAEFEYLGNSYVFVQDATGTDVVVKLTGTTGITNVGIDAGHHLFIV